ncbi:hypothetical protein EVAR_10804_1 [Eumeta japonica]|uniref:Uncharacterized protein n=1 Tax=Eumeta variegata TaxID=151549 RepID=A0A4C1Y5U2_EUMVA|nr:hypothetical protein EVAR_10804_1 [Eumeta japonica]
MYGNESWVRQKKKERKIYAVEMRSLYSMCGVSLKDRRRNSELINDGFPFFPPPANDGVDAVRGGRGGVAARAAAGQLAVRGRFQPRQEHSYKFLFAGLKPHFYERPRRRRRLRMWPRNYAPVLVPNLDLAFNAGPRCRCGCTTRLGVELDANLDGESI